MGLMDYVLRKYSLETSSVNYSPEAHQDNFKQKEAPLQ